MTSQLLIFHNISDISTCRAVIADRSAGEESTLRRLQLALYWPVRRMSTFEKFLLGSIHPLTWWEKDFCGLPGVFSRGRFNRKRVMDVGGFILLHAQNVTKEVKLSYDERRQHRAGLNSIF